MYLTLIDNMYKNPTNKCNYIDNRIIMRFIWSGTGTVNADSPLKRNSFGILNLRNGELTDVEHYANL